MNRSQAIADALDSRGVDGLLISDIRNVRYITGFSGSSGIVLLTRKNRIFCTDFRYKEQANREIKGFEVIIANEEQCKVIIEKAKAVGIRVLGFESTLAYEAYRKLLRKGVTIKAVSNVVEDVRKIKDSAETKLIRVAVQRAQKAFLETKPCIRKGVSERKIASVLECNLKKKGCSSLPFDIIVASGRNSSLPHARPSDKKVATGDFVVVDWGGEAGGYFSDMTRTLLIRGSGISKKREMYETVLKANRAVIDSVAEGVPARVLDKVARDIIIKAGYGDFFGHGTGHGVGLDVHELPRISRFGRESIKSGMVFTIEPGIYVPGLGGVRIEDMVCAEHDGCSVLTSLPAVLELIH